MSESLGFWSHESCQNKAVDPFPISQKQCCWMICLLLFARFHIYEPLGRLVVRIRSCEWNCGTYLNFQNLAQRSFWFLSHLHQILAPRIAKRISGSRRPSPPSFLERQRIFHATRAHFLLALGPFQRNFLLNVSNLFQYWFRGNKVWEDIQRHCLEGWH